METQKDRFVAFISWLIAGCVLLGMSLGTIITITIVRFSENDPYAFAFVMALIGSLCFTFMPRPKRRPTKYSPDVASAASAEQLSGL